MKKAEPVMNSFAKKALEKKQDAPIKKPNTQAMNSSRGGKPSAEPEEDEGNMIKANAKNKEKRSFNDGRTKYPINEVKGDHVEKLQA